jgi:Fe-S oxidoreductase
MTASVLAHTILIVAALVTFGWVLWQRFAVLRLSAPDPRTDHIALRLKRLLLVGFGQSRQPRYLVAGILHILIFAGFIILSIRSLTLLGIGFDPGFSLPGFDGSGGRFYAVLKDYTALVVLVACILAMLRRLVFHPARYSDRLAVKSHGHEAYVILGLIALLMVADALFEGTGRIVEPGEDPHMPMAQSAAVLLAGFSEPALSTIHSGAFWMHNVALLFFLCYLPVSKHFHVITSLPNVFLSKLKPTGHVKPPRHDVSDLDELPSLGVGKLEDFTWKHVLDFYTCTDCGRCSDHCPAYATGTPLSPRMISIKSRDLAYEMYPVVGKKPPANGRPTFVGETISPEELWACTTCGACEEACPVTIEYVDKIVDMRRFLVEQGDVPPKLQKTMADLEQRGNPFGKPQRTRAKWLQESEPDGPGVRVLEAGDEADILLFTDSAAAFDPRIQEISRSMASILQLSGQDAGIMGSDEVDSGHEVRRIGEEGLFEILRDQNMEAMEERSFKRVVTTDPHAFNALKNDGYDLDLPVLHHSQLMAELLDAGKLELQPIGDERTYTFHDPCYLGRHNGEYDAPRRVMGAIPGLTTVEMTRSKNRSFCCGGGLLSLYHEGESERRMGEKRLDMAADAGAQVVVTACPFCMINLEDAVKTTGREGEMEIIDLAELVSRSTNAMSNTESAANAKGEQN